MSRTSRSNREDGTGVSLYPVFKASTALLSNEIRKRLAGSTRKGLRNVQRGHLPKEVAPPFNESNVQGPLFDPSNAGCALNIELRTKSGLITE